MEDYLLITKETIEQNLTNLRQLVFEVTDSCNLRCKYCGYADLYEGYDKRENKKLPFDKAKLIIDYLFHNYWAQKKGLDYRRTINIGFYGGEPLLNVPFIKKVINYIEDLPNIGITFKYSMSSPEIGGTIYQLTQSCHFSDEVLNNSSDDRREKESRGHPRLCIRDSSLHYVPL